MLLADLGRSVATALAGVVMSFFFGYDGDALDQGQRGYGSDEESDDGETHLYKLRGCCGLSSWVNGGMNRLEL